MPLLVLLILGCFVMIASLKRRIDEADRRRDESIEHLLMRIRALEAKSPASQEVRDAPPVRSTVPTPPPVRPASAPIAPAARLARAARVEGAVRDVPAVPSVPVAPGEPDDAWEVVVGGSWLNKIGVLVFVIGVALLVGYSMTHVGPAGRVAMGFLLSLALLATGVVLERRTAYANYAYGLIAGGWAGAYFTTYAMHALDSARIVDNELAAGCALVAVAAGMVGHSLKYRSITVTALAYLVAYATLALTPLSGFALIAAVPLAITLLVVAHRFAWPGVAALGVICTYGVFALRGRVFPGGLMDPAALPSYLALAVYWAMFEIADLAALRQRRRVSIFALNAVGVLGAGVLQLPFENGQFVFAFLGLFGAAYLGSAIVRAAILRGRTTDQDPGLAAGNPQGALVVAAALAAWAIDVRFSGVRETVALLLETELLLVAGVVLGDRRIRRLASAGVVLTTLHAVSLIGHGAWLSVWPAAWHPWSPALALAAGCWYANREFLRAKRVDPEWVERLYTPVASVLVVGVLLWEAPPHTGIALYGFSVALLVTGLFLDPDYRYQGYVAGAFGALVLFNDCVALPSLLTNAQAATTLLAATAASYASALALLTRTDAGMRRADQPYAAIVAVSIGTAFLASLEWRLMDPRLVAPAWAATGFVHVLLGRWRQAIPLRVLGYLLLLAAMVRAIQPILISDRAAPTLVFWASVVIAALYLATIAGQSSAARTGAVADLEDAIRLAVSLAATTAMSTLVLHEVRPTAITLALGLQGAALLAAGFPLRERVLRRSGLALLLFCILKLFVHDLAELEALARILSFVVLGLVLLAVSWTYTRFREQIRKLL